MRAILIDPITRTVSAFEYLEGEDSPRIASILGCDWIDRTPLTARDDLWIDDEGRLVYPHPNGYFRIAGYIMCGRGLILSHDDQGESVGTSIPLGVIERIVEWIDTPPQEDVEPSFTITEEP